MSIEGIGRVSASEAHAIVIKLRDLAQRAADHHQGTFHFVFSLAADSLEDNVETAVEFQDGADIDGL
jgi:hypothetical protein